MSTDRFAGGREKKEKGHFLPVRPAGQECEIRRAAGPHGASRQVKPLGPSNPFDIIDCREPPITAILGSVVA